MAERREWDLGMELRSYADRGPRRFDPAVIATQAMRQPRRWRLIEWTSRPGLLFAGAVILTALVGSALVVAGAFDPPDTPRISLQPTFAPTSRAVAPLITPLATPRPARGGDVTFTPAGKLDIVPDGGARLADGRVLLVGYVEDGAPRARLWDPSSGRTTETGAPGVRHALAAFVALPNGSALMAGGALGSHLPGVQLADYAAYAERYDAATGTFGFTSKMAGEHGVCGCGGSWPHPVGIGLRDGRVLIVGGLDAPDPQAIPVRSLVVEVYDPASDAFRALGAIESGVTQLVGVLLDDGRVLLKAMDRAWLVDVDTGSINDAPPTATTSDRFATVLDDGRVLITGAGTSASRTPSPTTRPTEAEIYDPATNTFRALEGQVNPPGTHMGISASLRDGRVLFMRRTATWVFDPATTRFTKIAAAAGSPFEPVVAVSLHDGRVLVLADDGSIVLADVGS